MLKSFLLMPYVGEARSNHHQRLQNLGIADSAQISFARRKGFVILTYNVRHFPRLHYEILSRNEHHPGFIIARQEGFILTLRRFLKLLASLSAEDMQDALEYLSNWPVDE